MASTPANAGEGGIAPSVSRQSWLAIGAAVISAVCASFRPVETFILAYAILGPLHYLTELSWLHDRKFFTGRLWDGVVLFAMAAVLFGLVLVVGPTDAPWLCTGLIGAAMGYAVGACLDRRGGAALVGGGVGVVLSTIPVGYLLIGVLVPTLIHVLLFTLLFMASGATRSRDPGDWMAIGLVVLLALAMLGLGRYGVHVPSKIFTDDYGVVGANGVPDGMLNMNFQIVQVLGIQDFPGGSERARRIMQFLYVSPPGRALLSLVAYAYLHHYLNWFIKAPVIAWNRISQARTIGIVVIWLSCVGLYFVNFRIGAMVLFTLSLAHVLCEFPLNIRSGQSLLAAMLPTGRKPI